MRKLLGILAAAGLLVFGADGASAQGVDVRIRVGEPGYHRRVVRDYDRPVIERRIVERRRIMRPAPRLVCRTVMRERVRPSGVVVRRPVEVCRRTYAGGRVYVRWPLVGLDR